MKNWRFASVLLVATLVCFGFLPACVAAESTVSFVSSKDKLSFQILNNKLNQSVDPFNTLTEEELLKGVLHTQAHTLRTHTHTCTAHVQQHAHT